MCKGVQKHFKKDNSFFTVLTVTTPYYSNFKAHLWSLSRLPRVVMVIPIQLNIYIYYIPTNVIGLDTVNFTECDPMLRITTLWFTPLWNWWRSTQCFSQYTMHEVLWRHSYRTIQNLYQVLTLFQNDAYKSYPKHKHILLMHLE